MIQKLSPRHDASKLASQTTADRIDVYEDRVRGWLIDSARILNEHEHTGFAVLQVGLANFEALAVFQRGEDSRGRPPEFFKEGFWSVFDESDVEGLPLSLKGDFDQRREPLGVCGSAARSR